MTHVDSSVRAWEVQCKILTLNAFHKKRRGHAETWIRNPSAQNFLINKVVLSIYMQKYLLLFPFSPQIVKSILAFLSFKNDVMARSTRCYF